MCQNQNKCFSEITNSSYENSCSLFNLLALVKYVTKELYINAAYSVHLAQKAVETRSFPFLPGYWRVGSDGLPG